jgi:isopenicillin-N N-acyltransferase-like protein
MAHKFPLLKVSGSRYNIGLQVGEALRDKIPRVIGQIFDYELALCKKWTKGESLPAIPDFTPDDVLKRTRDFIPLFERYCPLMLEELRGIAAGAGLSFEEALLLQIRGEVVYAIAGGCTSFVFSRDVTKEQEIIIGQNWDYPIDLDLLLILHLTPEDSPAQLMMTFAGLTSYMGINAAGIGNFANALPWGWCQIGIPHYPFKWRIFQQANLAGIRRVCDETKTVQPGNYVFCDGSGEIADVELTPEGAVWLDNVEGFFVHTNHFLGEPFRSRPDLPPLTEDSISRYQRMYGFVKKSYGQVDVSLMQKFLSDHDNYPVSLCRHEEYPALCTSASLIAEPEHGVLHACAGNPCKGEYVTYCL